MLKLGSIAAKEQLITEIVTEIVGKRNLPEENEASIYETAKTVALTVEAILSTLTNAKQHALKFIVPMIVEKVMTENGYRPEKVARFLADVDVDFPKLYNIWEAMQTTANAKEKLLVAAIPSSFDSESFAKLTESLYTNFFKGAL